MGLGTVCIAVGSLMLANIMAGGNGARARRQRLPMFEREQTSRLADLRF